MPLFNSQSPFDIDVEKATNELNATEDQQLFREICYRVLSTPNGPKDCLKSIVKRMNSKVPVVAMQAISLLDMCVQTCGHNFRSELATPDFVAECRSCLNKMNPKVSQRLKLLIRKWAENEFRADPSLSSIPQLYNSLKSEGHVFPVDDVPKETLMSMLKREESDIAQAIALSLKNGGMKSSKSGTNSVGSDRNSFAEPRKVKALYDFEAVEDNEMTFSAGDIINVLDDSDSNWWKGSSARGEGLFPANFVTADLTVVPEPEVVKSRKSVHFQEEVQVNIVEPAPIFEIEECKIDEALQLIQSVDPTEEFDSNHLLQLEEQCKAMAPLIDQELEKIDKQHLTLSDFNEKLLDAFKMYHQLMGGVSQIPYNIQNLPEQHSLPQGFTPQPYSNQVQQMPPQFPEPPNQISESYRTNYVYQPTQNYPTYVDAQGHNLL